MDARNRARWGSVAVLAVVFASGIVVGVAWDRRLDAAETEAVAVAEETTAPGAEEESREPRRRRPMYEQVDPTDAQRVRIDSIVEAYRLDARTFHRNSREEYDAGMRALVVQTREAIKGVLNPDQAERYDSLTSARDARVREREAEREAARDADEAQGDEGEGRDGN